MLDLKARAHRAMERVSFVLLIAVFVAFGFPQPCSSGQPEKTSSKRQKKNVK